MIVSKKNKFGGKKSQFDVLFKICQENNLKLSIFYKNYSIVMLNSNKKLSIISLVSLEV